MKFKRQRQWLAGVIRMAAQKLDPQLAVKPDPQTGGYTIGFEGISLARITPGMICDTRPPITEDADA